MVKHDYLLNKQVFVTSGPSVKSNHADISMEESDHEEPDSRICLHVHNTLKEGATTIHVRTVDCDVIVMLVGIFHDLVPHYSGTQYGLALVQENISGITTSNQYARNLGRTKLELNHSSMLSPVLMQHPSSAVNEKRHLGRHGNLTQQPQKDSPSQA